MITLLARVRERQGRIIGLMRGMGFEAQSLSSCEMMTEEVLRNAEIEGMMLNADQVRSSVARHLGVDNAGLTEPDHYTEAVVQIMIDATTDASKSLTEQRLFNWHAALFPTGRSGIVPINVGRYREGAEPILVVSGAMGKEKVHYQAPDSSVIPQQMALFLDWINQESSLDPLLKAGIAHLWFINIHPFDDGNGRLTRTITDMMLARADGQRERYYSMSAEICKDKKAYYDILEYTGKHGLDITMWLRWFLQTLEASINMAMVRAERMLKKSVFWQKNAGVVLNQRQVKVINRLWDGFEGKLSSGKWAKMTHSSQATALRDIQDLIDKKILKKNDDSGRSTNYDLIIE